MKLKSYPFLKLFILVLIILYPLIYYFTNIKVTQRNNDLTSYNYEITGFIKFKNLEKISEYLNSEIKKINNTYFDGKKVASYYPRYQFPIEKNLETITITEETTEITISDIHLNKLLIYFDNTLIFYFDLEELSYYFRKDFNDPSYFYSAGNDCSNISQELRRLKYINFELSQFDFIVSQKKILNKENPTSEEIAIFFKNCISQKLNSNNIFADNYIETYYQIMSKEFELSLNEFIKNNENFFKNLEEKQKLKDEINIIKKEIIFNLKNLDVDIDVINPSIRLEEKFQKKFNIYVITFILSTLISLVIIYFLIFVKSNFRFFKKFF